MFVFVKDGVKRNEQERLDTEDKNKITTSLKPRLSATIWSLFYTEETSPGKRPISLFAVAARFTSGHALKT